MKRTTLSLLLLAALVTAAPSMAETNAATAPAAAPSKADTKATAPKAATEKSMKAKSATAVVKPMEKAAEPAEKTADQAAAVPDQGEHTVIKGDTLWDLSGEYLKDPFMWPEVWKINPGIENPNLIYPGEKVRIPGLAGAKPEQPVAEKPAAPAETKAAREKAPFEEEPFVDISQTLLVVPEKEDRKVISLDESKKVKIPVATEGAILEAGFISKDTEDTTTVAGSKEIERSVYSTGDDIYVNPMPGVKTGDLLMTFRPELELDHPVTGDYMGDIEKTSGLLRVQGERDGYLLCSVDQIANDIRINDLAMPYTRPALVYDPVEKNPKLRGEWGYVIAGYENKKLNAGYYIVYLDLGSSDGVKPGDTFEVRRSGGDTRPALRIVPRDNERLYIVSDIIDDIKENIPLFGDPLPDVVVGDVQIISVQERTSTAKVLEFKEPVRPGYRVYYKD